MGTLPRSDDEPRPAAARVLGLVGLLGLACQGPVGVKAPPGESSTGDGGAATSTGDGGAATSTGEPPPDRVPPEPFVLPEGCGDGVIVPGQYDCFFPVSIDWLEEEVGRSLQIHPLDLDGDGRDEMIAYAGSGAQNVAVLRWDDLELRVGPLVDSAGGRSLARIDTRWDWNRDGLRDLTVLMQYDRPEAWMYPNLGAEGVGEGALIYESPPFAPPSGFLGAGGMAAIDADVDGIPELLISRVVEGHGNANPKEDLVLMRRSGMTAEHWEDVGEAYRWGPCGHLAAYAVGDFDGDGDEDIAVLDHGQACDPYPSSYDPEWYRVYVLLSNAEKGVLELGGSYPTGGAVKDPILWTEDVTGDGHLDLIVEIDDPLEYGVAVMRGRGDGTFHEGAPVDLGPDLPSYNARALIDVDGDGTREWIVTVVEGRPWVIPFDFSKEGIAPMVALNDPEAGGSTRFKEAVGDINGDGVDDYRVRAAYSGRYRGEFLMISAP